MRVGAGWWSGVALIAAGCIPQAEPPARYRAADVGGRPWPYARRTPDHGAGAVSPAPASAEPAPSYTAPAPRDAAEAQRRTGDAGDGPDAPASTEARVQSPARSRGRQRATPPSAPPLPPPAVPAPPAARPAWEARPIVPDAVTIPDGSAVVRPGDTLGAVAERTGAGAAAIARANGLSPPYAVRAGQRLVVPGGRYHLVRAGQSGIGIARAYGVPWPRIVDANGFAEPFTLRAGQRIAIPGAPGAASAAAERAAAFRLDVDTILTGGEPALARNEAPAAPVATATRVLPSTAAIAPPARLRTGFDWPADGRVLKRFGHGESGERNDGIEIAAALRSPVKAAADGVVAYAGTGIAALGGLVIVRHGDGWSSVYGHASKLLVQRGQSVRQGQAIALAGDTGFASRPEVHFELRRGRTPVDPATRLPERPER